MFHLFSTVGAKEEYTLMGGNFPPLAYLLFTGNSGSDGSTCCAYLEPNVPSSDFKLRVEVRATRGVQAVVRVKPVVIIL